MLLKGYLIKEIENFFPFSYRVIETLVEVWEKLEIAWNHSIFRFSQTSTRASITLYRKTGNVFYFLDSEYLALSRDSVEQHKTYMHGVKWIYSTPKTPQVFTNGSNSFCSINSVVYDKRCLLFINLYL